MGAVLFYGVVVLLAYLVFRVFEPFLAPLAWASILVVVFHPWHRRLERRLGRTWAAAASATAVTLILIVPTLVIMGAFVRQGIDAARLVQEELTSGRLRWAEDAWNWVQHRVPGVSVEDLTALMKQDAEKFARFLAARLGSLLRHIAIFVFHLVVVILAMFYLFRDGDGVMNRVRRALPFEEGLREKMIAEARDLIFASVTSSLAVAAIQGTLGGVAFAAVGIHAPVFWGVIMAFFSLLPLVGAWIIWAPAAIWLLSRGQTGRAIALVVVCAGVVSLVDNVVRPWMISGRARMSGLVVFISLLGGITLFGMLGIILGPIVVATAISVLDLYSSRDSGGSPPAEVIGKKPGAVLE